LFLLYNSYTIMSTFIKKVTSAVAGLAIVFSIVSPIAGVSAAFSGLEAANKLSTLAIIENQSANPADYRLGDSSSREELSKVISNLAGLTAVSSDSVYQDTDFASWSEKYAKALNEAGMAASNNYFNPKDMTSKIEALKWVMEARSIETGTGADWMEARVNGAVAAGIATSFSDYSAEATRGQVFIWAAEAIATDEVVVEATDPLCELLGICEDPVVDEPMEPTDSMEPTDPTAPMVTSDAEVSLSPLSPTSNVVAGGKPRTSILAFDVTAGSSDLTLGEVTLEYIGLSDDANFSVLAVYIGNDKVTKGTSKSFDNDGEAELSFENDTVIQAGETITLMVTSTVGLAANSAHQIRVMDIKASSTVVLGTVRSVVFDVISAANTATLDINVDPQTGKETVGETVIFADFDAEADDKEDVVIKSMTFEFDGSVDFEDDIADLVLMADGVEIASNLMFNSDDEIIVDLDFTIDADQEVTFNLEGVITGSIGDNLTVTVTDIYALGADTGIIATLDDDMADNTELTATVTTVEGSEINVSWDKGDVDEVKPDTTDVVIGTLNLEAASDYVVNDIEVTVTVTGGSNVEDVITEIELGGKNADADALTNTNTATYNFEDINLSQGIKEMLALTVEIADDSAINGQVVDFDIVIIEVEDEDNDETYNGGTLSTVLSSNSFDTKSIDIETASYTLTQTSISQRNLVLGNGIDVILYRGKVNTGDSDDVTFDDITFTGQNGLSNGVVLEDILDSVTLNIGWITETGEVSGDNVEFNNADIEVPAGSNNIEVLVTAIFKDDDDIVNADDFRITLTLDTQIDASDSNGDDIAALNETINSVALTNVVELNENGSFTIAIVNDGEHEDDVEDVVLAGSASVTLAEITLEAEDENMDVEELRFTISGAFDTTLKNVRLMDGATTIADGATVTIVGPNTVIEFENFVVEDTGNEIDATLVADLEIITTEGGVATAISGSIVVNALVDGDMVIEGSSSNDTIDPDTTAVDASTAVAVVPVLMTVAVAQELGVDEDEAIISFNLDFGNNDLDADDVVVTQIALESGLGAPGLTLRNDDNGLITVTSDTATPLLLTADAEINDGDEFTFEVPAEGDELIINVNGVTFTVNGDTYTSLNDKVIDLDNFTDSTN
jgi:hypothetical protein